DTVSITLGYDNFFVHGGAGGDGIFLSGESPTAASKLYGDDDDDVISAATGTLEVHGGDGDDVLGANSVSGTGPALYGEKGDDFMSAGLGSNVLDGGDGDSDTVSYASRANSVTVTADGVANDGDNCASAGPACEADNV